MLTPRRHNVTMRRHVAGLVLTGGRSRRMGTAKADLDPGDGGLPLGQRVANALQEAGLAPVLEVGSAATGLENVVDPGQGPLVAVAAASAVLGHQVPAVVAACDLPGLTPTLVRFLADHPATGSVVPLAQGQPQVLCARWSGAALARSVTLVDQGERAMRALLSLDDTVLVPEASWMAWGGPHALTDLDTRDDVEAWRAMMEP